MLGGVIQGGSPDITVTKPHRFEAIGSTQDVSSIYPPASLLPGGGNATFAYVAEKPGRYKVSTAGGIGAYDILLEVYRPGSVTAKKQTVQKVFLDFNGERVNTAVWAARGPVLHRSPRSSDVGLTKAHGNAVINRVIETVRENIRRDLKQKGLNDRVRVKIRNSRDHRTRSAAGTCPA